MRKRYEWQQTSSVFPIDGATLKEYATNEEIKWKLVKHMPHNSKHYYFWRKLIV